tara:strand:+ start:20327 stop:21445 length:1119 start_codon:yes stop_codon:yes gene_type:complete
MPVSSSPSDYTNINVDYSQGRGFYTDKTSISDLLQIPAFTSVTNPTDAQIGAIIKRTEGIIDDKINRSFRPIIWKDEFRDFEFTHHPINSYYSGYVGFVQLNQMKVRKIISLQVWEGTNYRELASAQASISLDTSKYNKIRKLTLTLPNSVDSWDLFYSGEGGKSATQTFNLNFGAKTTAKEIVALINEQFPARTAQFTGATAEKANTSLTNGYSISDFFYAYTDSQDGTLVHISSLLEGEDGSDCTLTVTDQAGQTSDSVVTNFTDKQEMKRLGDFWMMGSDGRIFFNKKYPYHRKNSVIVSFVAGDGRVPSAIHEAATKLVAAEILRHDDQTILIAETGANISTKEKYDILRKEGMEILDGKKDLVYLID